MTTARSVAPLTVVTTLSPVRNRNEVRAPLNASPLPADSPPIGRSSSIVEFAGQYSSSRK